MKTKQFSLSIVPVLLLLLLLACGQLQDRLFIDVTPEDTFVTVVRDADGRVVYQGFGDVTLTGLGPGMYRVMTGEGADASVDQVVVPAQSYLELSARSSLEPRAKATGSVEIVWKGGQGSGAPQDKRAYAELEWFDGSAKKPDRGEFRYLVSNADGTPHREIVAKVTENLTTGVVVDITNSKAQFVGEVIADTKFCSGGDCGGHDGGGCGGGCEDGGCSGDHDEGDCGGDGGHGGSGQIPGRESRVGQMVAVKLHDGGTPATNGDGITWKWFEPEAAPSITNLDWPHLCQKTIIAGNLQVGG